jgi:hypothetical protein
MESQFYKNILLPEQVNDDCVMGSVLLGNWVYKVMLIVVFCSSSSEITGYNLTSSSHKLIVISSERRLRPWQCEWQSLILGEILQWTQTDSAIKASNIYAQL